MKLWNSIGAERSQTCRGDPGEKVGTELAGFPSGAARHRRERQERNASLPPERASGRCIPRRVAAMWKSGRVYTAQFLYSARTQAALSVALAQQHRCSVWRAVTRRHVIL
jgi:hypothetical protein